MPAPAFLGASFGVCGPLPLLLLLLVLARLLLDGAVFGVPFPPDSDDFCRGVLSAVLVSLEGVREPPEPRGVLLLLALPPVDLLPRHAVEGRGGGGGGG